LYLRHLQHPLFAWLGLRPVFAQHTQAESEAIRRWARGRKNLVEIGVAEGASALALREVMDPEGILYLIDPFHLSRFPLVNATRRTARRTVNQCRNGRVVWIEKFSFDAVKGWTTPIDFLFLDGDHSEDAVRRDWKDWHCLITVGGVFVFHDARMFAGGWTSPLDGPVRVVDKLFRSSVLSGWEIVDEVHSLVIVRRCH
jgi:predicted O-methyltransferase YrrM